MPARNKGGSSAIRHRLKKFFQYRRLRHREARNSTISTPRPMRMRIVARNTGRFCVAGASGPPVVSGAVELVVSVIGVGLNAVSALDDAAVSVSSEVAVGRSVVVVVAVGASTFAGGMSFAAVADEPPAAGGDDPAVAAGAGTAAVVGGAEGLGVLGAGVAAAGLRVTVEDAAERVGREVDVDDREVDVDDREVDADVREVDVVDRLVVERVVVLRGVVRVAVSVVRRGCDVVTSGSGVELSLRVTRGAGVAARTPRRCRRWAAMPARNSRDSAAG